MKIKKMVLTLLSDCTDKDTDVFPSRYPSVILKSDKEKDVSKSSYTTGNRSYLTGYTDKISTWWNSLDEDKVNRDKLKLGYISDSKCERYTTEEYKYSACIERSYSNKKHKVLEYSPSVYSPPLHKKSNKQITAFNSVSKSFKNKYDKHFNYSSDKSNLLHENNFPIYSFQKPHYTKIDEIVIKNHATNNIMERKYDDTILIYENNFPIYSMNKPHYIKWFTSCAEIILIKPKSKQKPKKSTLLYNNSWPIYNFSNPHYSKTYVTNENLYIQSYTSETNPNSRKLSYRRYSDGHGLISPYYVKRQDQLFKHYKSQCVYKSDVYNILDTKKKQDQLFKHYKTQCAYKDDVYKILDTEMTGYYGAEVAHVKNSISVDKTDSKKSKIRKEESKSEVESEWQKNAHTSVDDTDSNMLKISKKESKSEVESGWQKNAHTSVDDTNSDMLKISKKESKSEVESGWQKNAHTKYDALINKRSFNSSSSDLSKIQFYERQIGYNDMNLKTKSKEKEPNHECSFSEYIYNATKGKYSIPRLNLNTNYKPVYNHSRPPYYTQKHATL